MLPPLPSNRAPFPLRAWLALWESPQNLLGVLLLLLVSGAGRVRSRTHEADRLFIEVDGLGVSLGWFVFWSAAGTDVFPADPLMRRHEWGHTFQSRRLGPLYLPLVGLPSVSRAAYAWAHYRVTKRAWGHYYDAYPEDWADRLGGVAEAREERRRRRAAATPRSP